MPRAFSGTKFSRATAPIRASTYSALTPLVRSWLSIIALRAAACAPACWRSSTMVTSARSLVGLVRGALGPEAPMGNGGRCRKRLLGQRCCAPAASFDHSRPARLWDTHSTGRRARSMSDMVTIRESDLIESVADALQFISYYHPMDYIRALGAAYEAEQGPAAKDAIAQILTNSRMCA